MTLLLLAMMPFFGSNACHICIQEKKRSMNDDLLKKELKDLESHILEITPDPLDYKHHFLALEQG